MKTITVYSTTTCPYCVMLTRWLEEKGMKYTEYKVDQNPFAAQQMINISGQMGVPFTTVEDSTETTKILGFNIPQLQAALAI